MDNFFSKFQCGFRKGYSTQQCLLALIEKWKSAVDKGKSFGALLTDLSKALDCLPHELGRVAWWLATCARKPKVPGSSPAASYAQR